MKCNAVIAATIIGFAAAAPMEKREAKPVAVEKRVGPIALAVGGAVLGGFVGPVVTRVFNDVFGVQTKRSTVDGTGDWSFTEARELFISKSVEAIYDEDEKDEAAVCVSVGYTVSDPSKTGDSASFRFEADGETVE